MGRPKKRRHCECFPGWLDQILMELEKNPNSIAVPVVEPIHANSFDISYTSLSKVQIAGFDWNLDIHFLCQKNRHKMKKNNLVEPMPSPVLPHGIFAVKRDWFFSIGGFDQRIDNAFGEGDTGMSDLYDIKSYVDHAKRTTIYIS